MKLNFKYIALALGVLAFVSLIAVGGPAKSAYAQPSADPEELVFHKSCDGIFGVDNTIDDLVSGGAFNVLVDFIFEDPQGGTPPAPNENPDFTFDIECDETVTFNLSDATLDPIFDYFTLTGCAFNGNTQPCWDTIDWVFTETNLIPGMLDTWDGDQQDQFCDGGPGGSERQSAIQVGDDFLSEGLGCEIHNFFAQAGEAFTITVTKVCIGTPPFVPDTFDIFMHYEGTIDDNIPVSQTALLGDVECDSVEAFFVPAGAVTCFFFCDNFEVFLVETPPDGIAVTIGGDDCDPDGAIGDDEFGFGVITQTGLGCTVTNTFNPAILTITKVCDPVDATTDPFTVDIDQVGGDFDEDVEVTCGGEPVEVELGSGTFVISEDATGFNATFDGDCPVLVAVLGGEYACTITNTEDEEDPTTLTIAKVCEGDDGFEATFDATASGLADMAIVCGGDTGAVEVTPGPFTVGEEISGADAANFTTTISCVLNGVVGGASVILAEGDDAICVITNTFDDPEIPGPPAPCDDCGCGCGGGDVINDIDIINTNINTNIIDNVNTNTLTNDNVNTNENANDNSQDQTNDNSQTINVDASPVINIDLD